MGLFDKQEDINEEELSKLKKQKIMLEEEYHRVKEYTQLKEEINNAKQSIINLRKGTKNINSSNGQVGNAIKSTFQGFGEVLGMMASNSKANEEKALKNKKCSGR